MTPISSLRRDALRQEGFRSQPIRVAKVYPELVAYDKVGQPYAVHYQYLSTMLLNEVQKQQRVNTAQAEKIASLERQLVGIQAALVDLQPKEKLVAQR